MDLASGLRDELFRPVVTIVIPGVLAMTPFVFVLGLYYPRLPEFIHDESGLAAFLGFIAAITFGLLSYEIGTIGEAEMLDRILVWWTRKKLTTESNPFLDNWYLYLRCTFDENKEPIGQRYIHDVILYLRFELNMAASLLIGWIGILWLHNKGSVLSGDLFWYMSLVCFVGAGLFLLAALSTGGILARVRAELLKGCQRPPF